MGRKKKPQTLPELYAAKEEAEAAKAALEAEGAKITLK